MLNDPKKRFSDRAADYKKFRPAYPEAAIQFVKDRCDVTDDWAMADIGSGTGISAAILLKVFNRPLYAVEPNRDMRLQAENAAGGNPLYHSIDGSSENTTLPDKSVDMVAAFQAFHWFDREKARREFRRILRGSRWVLLVWNDRAAAGTEFIEEYDSLLRQLPDYHTSSHRSIEMKEIQKFLGEAALITAEFPHSQQLDCEGLKGRFFSASYTPAYGTDEYHKQMRNLEKLFDKTNRNGIVEFLYTTRIYLGQMSEKDQA